MDELLNTLIENYIQNAKTHGQATQEGNYKIANKAHDNLLKTLHKILSFNTEGSDQLLKLIDHSDDSVKIWAATHSLKYDKVKSEKALNELSQKDGIESFNAEMVLNEWKKGTLKIL